MNNNSEYDTMADVITSGLYFLRALTTHYGPDKGIEIWNSMSDSLGREVKGKIFFKMITGESGSKVVFNAGAADQHGMAIPVIKAIRVASGLGLKEAKDLWDNSKTNTVTFDTHNIDAAIAVKKELRQFGCIVHV